MRKTCYEIATLFGVGSWPGGDVVAAIFSLGFLSLIRKLSFFSGSIGSILLLLFTLACFFVIQGALGYEGDFAETTDVSKFVLSRFLGTLLLLHGVPLDYSYWKLIYSAPVLYYLVIFAIDQCSQGRFARFFQMIPGFAHVVVFDIIVGLVGNCLMHLVLTTCY